ncbi:MAG: hypothetical protein NUV97_00980 [archaeon]|nr:hypothetical protein [archaeon]MCR4323466.1 hypothetical protein [Nanoarchaeota archaeon]
MKDINLFPTKDSIFLKEISTKSEISNKDECDGYLIKSSEKESRRIVESLKKSNKLIAFLGGDDALNRRAVETLKINYLISPESGNKSDTLKQRDSGINHVVAKEAAKKKITILINFSEVSKVKGKEKARRLARIMQNIKICRKAKCQIKIASLARDEKEVKNEKTRQSFGTSLGMSSEQTKNCIRF